MTAHDEFRETGAESAGFSGPTPVHASQQANGRVLEPRPTDPTMSEHSRPQNHQTQQAPEADVALINALRQGQAPGLANAACDGLGAAEDVSSRDGAMDSLATATLVNIDAPETLPKSRAARSAAGALGPAVQLDPLTSAHPPRKVNHD